VAALRAANVDRLELGTLSVWVDTPMTPSGMRAVTAQRRPQERRRHADAWLLNIIAVTS